MMQFDFSSANQQKLKKLFREKNYVGYGKMLTSLTDYEEKKTVMDYFFQPDGLRHDYLVSDNGVSYKAFFEQITPFIKAQVAELGSLNTHYTLQNILDIFIIANNEKVDSLAQFVLEDLRKNEVNDNKIFEILLEQVNFLGSVEDNKMKDDRLQEVLFSAILNFDLDLSNVTFSKNIYSQILDVKDVDVLKFALTKKLDLSKQPLNTILYMAGHKNPLLISLSLKDELISQLVNFQAQSTQNQSFKSLLNNYLMVLDYVEQIKPHDKFMTEYMFSENLLYQTRIQLADFLTNCKKDNKNFYNVNLVEDREIVAKAFHQIKYVSINSWYKDRQAHSNLKAYDDIFYFLVDKAFIKPSVQQNSRHSHINTFYLMALSAYLDSSDETIKNNSFKNSALGEFLIRFSQSVVEDKKTMLNNSPETQKFRQESIEKAYQEESNILNQLFKINKHNFLNPFLNTLNANEILDAQVIKIYNEFAKSHQCPQIAWSEKTSGLKKLMGIFSFSKKEEVMPIGTIANQDNISLINSEEGKSQNKYSIDYLKMHELLDHPKMDLDIFLTINKLYAKSKVISKYLQEDKIQYVEKKLLLKSTFEQYLPQILMNYVSSIDLDNNENDYKQSTIEQIQLLSNQINQLEGQIMDSQKTEATTSIAEFGEFLKSKLGSNEEILQDEIAIQDVKKNLKMGQ